MAISFSIRDTDKISGYNLGRSVPSGNVEVTEVELAQYRAAKRALASARRSELPVWDGSAVVVPPDTRPIFGVVANRATENVAGVDAIPILADGVDSVTFTVTAYRPNGVDVRAQFNGLRFFEVDDDVYWRVSFVDGVGSKVMTTTTLGWRMLQSSRRRRLLSELTVLAHE